MGHGDKAMRRSGEDRCTQEGNETRLHRSSHMGASETHKDDDRHALTVLYDIILCVVDWCFTHPCPPSAASTNKEGPLEYSKGDWPFASHGPFSGHRALLLRRELLDRAGGGGAPLEGARAWEMSMRDDLTHSHTHSLTSKGGSVAEQSSTRAHAHTRDGVAVSYMLTR